MPASKEHIEYKRETTRSVWPLYALQVLHAPTFIRVVTDIIDGKKELLSARHNRWPTAPHKD